MRIFLFLITSVTIALILAAVNVPQSSTANRAITHPGHPIAGIADVFRGY